MASTFTTKSGPEGTRPYPKDVGGTEWSDVEKAKATAAENVGVEEARGPAEVAYEERQGTTATAYYDHRTKVSEFGSGVLKDNNATIQAMTLDQGKTARKEREQNQKSIRTAIVVGFSALAGVGLTLAALNGATTHAAEVEKNRNAEVIAVQQKPGDILDKVPDGSNTTVRVGPDGSVDIHTESSPK